LGRKLTLISAPAGFGKTTLLSEWLIGRERPAAWLSLDEGDNDPARFLTYLIASLQQLALRRPTNPSREGAEGIEASIGDEAMRALQASQPLAPPIEAILISLINQIAAIPERIILVLDDYHVIEAYAVDQALNFLLDHLPLAMHLVIASRIDPSLPLSRLRARDQMTEIREADLRFSVDESRTFLDQVMGLNLSAENVAALDQRTEGWIVGLQLAALSMQGLETGDDIAKFVDRFTGSDRYIHDYLTDEVLRQRPGGTEEFLLQTSILNHLCGPLCDAVRSGPAETPRSSYDSSSLARQGSQAILESLEAANLFIIPLDNERRWYRYHHLFADLLRQRLQRRQPDVVADLHRRASVWYEQHDLEIEAFNHAAAAHDVERAVRLIEGKGVALTLRGGLAPVLNWLKSLPAAEMDRKPGLWIMYGSALMIGGQRTGVEEKLQAAEAALRHLQHGAEPVSTAPTAGAETGFEDLDEHTRDLIGRIATIRATMALDRNQEEVIVQYGRALQYLHPDNLASRTTTTWMLGIAHNRQGDRAAARQGFSEAISICEASGNIFLNILASTGLGQLQEGSNQLHEAADTYQRILQMVGDPPHPAGCEAHLGLARIHYEWNDMEAAQQHGQQSAGLARQIDSVDSFAGSAVFLSRLGLTQGDLAGATAHLAEAERFVRQHDFVYQLPDVAAARVGLLLQQGDLAAAAELAAEYELPVSQARVYLGQGDPSAALAVLGPFRQRAEEKGWQDDVLKVAVLQALAHQAAGDMERAVQNLGDALALAEPGGFIRTFVDEGAPMANMISEAADRGVRPAYARKLLAAFGIDQQPEQPRGPASQVESQAQFVQPLIEPLSPRELEVLQLIAQGLTNREIGEKLYLALNTIKAHNANIFGKLDVHRRTEAVARARELGLL
jgi:LuxR family maltose regulon positive regulatory protein